MRSSCCELAEESLKSLASPLSVPQLHYLSLPLFGWKRWALDSEFKLIKFRINFHAIRYVCASETPTCAHWRCLLAGGFRHLQRNDTILKSRDGSDVTWLHHPYIFSYLIFIDVVKTVVVYIGQRESRSAKYKRKRRSKQRREKKLWAKKRRTRDYFTALQRERARAQAGSGRENLVNNNMYTLLSPRWREELTCLPMGNSLRLLPYSVRSVWRWTWMTKHTTRAAEKVHTLYAICKNDTKQKRQWNERNLCVSNRFSDFLQADYERSERRRALYAYLSTLIVVVRRLHIPSS